MTRDFCVHPMSWKFHKVCRSAAASGRSEATALKSWSWEYLHVGIASPPELPSIDLRADLCIWNGAQILMLTSWWQQEVGRQGVNALLGRVAFTFLSFAIRCPSWWSDYCPDIAPEGWASSGAPLASLPPREDITGTPVLLTCSQVLRDRF